MLDIPSWLQLPCRDFCENIYAQYARSLPGAVMDAAKEKAYIDTNKDFDQALEKFYSSVLEDPVGDFALHHDYAHGFFALIDFLKRNPKKWS